MNAIEEFYADYVMPNGLIKRTTFYTEPEYLNIIFIQEMYKNRVDKLICVDTKYDVEETETIEYFRPGRDDYLKSTILSILKRKKIVRNLLCIFLQNISFMAIAKI